MVAGIGRCSVRALLGVSVGLGIAAASPTVGAQAEVDAQVRLGDIERRLEDGERRLRELEAAVAEERRRLDGERKLYERRLRGDDRLDGMTGRGASEAVAQAPSGPVGEAPPAP